MTREEKLKKLEIQFKEEFAGNGYPKEFKAHSAMMECNFGGMLVIISNSGDAVVVWSDWSDAAVSDVLTECEIEYILPEDCDDDETAESEAAFLLNDTWYGLNNFMRI